DVDELEAQEILVLQQSLLQSSLLRSRLSISPDDKEKRFALDEVRKAWYIHEIKERLDLGDVKEDLLSQLSSLQKQCPDAEEIKAQMADIWEEVGRWVKAEDLRLAMEREAQSIESLKARMNLDVEGTKNKIKELQMQCENVSKAFTKDQESRLFEIVNVAARLQELKKLISNAVHSDDVRVWQEQYDPLQKAYKELTKDLNDSQLQQAFQFVTLKQDIETNEEQISKEHIEGELKKWTEVPQYRYNALQRQLAKLKQDLDVNSIESQIMAIWYKSLHDLPDMADLRNASSP
ncbi:Hypothetical protein SCF082_LOCUS45384, partial [Durusdinium trenchii]